MADVAYQDYIENQEDDLPCPIVLYPGHYGAFFGFKRKDGQQNITICACAYEAIENYIDIRNKYDNNTYASAAMNFVLSQKEFPKLLVESLIQQNAPSSKQVIDYLTFETSICHECNSVMPELKYCHPMYGSKFKQQYGWYVKKQAYEWGIDLTFLNFLPGKIPEEVRNLVEIDVEDAGLLEVLQPKTEEAKEFQKKIRSQNRTIRNAVENEVRDKFNYNKIGEKWISETTLYYIIKQLLPNKTVERHARPDFLDGLELDVYLPEESVGIEYQGEQHYEPIEHWGGEKALERTKERDSKKKQLAEENDIKLVYFTYKEELTKELVKDKLKQYI